MTPSPQSAVAEEVGQEAGVENSSMGRVKEKDGGKGKEDGRGRRGQKREGYVGGRRGERCGRREETSTPHVVALLVLPPYLICLSKNVPPL